MTICFKLSVAVADFSYLHFALYCITKYKESCTPSTKTAVSGMLLARCKIAPWEFG